MADSQHVNNHLTAYTMTNTDEACCWYPERQELHVNLLPIIGIHTTLVLTSWNHSSGITWSLITDDGIESYEDPFSAPFFQISDFLNVCAAKPYLDEIPVEVMQALRPYRADNFGLLMLLSQNKNLTKIYGKYSTLFWLLFRQAKNEGWVEQQFISLCESGIWNVLKALNLPANQAALKFLSKITASHCYTQFHVDLIHQTFRDLDYRHLNSKLEIAPDHLLQFLLRFPHLQHVNFLGQLKRDDYYVFRDCIKRLRSALIKRDVVNVTQQITTVLATSDSLDTLRTYEKRVSDANR
jgi:hypothetical protein